mmetsp:Transcript_29796/g.41161  ORF Transcript_29796/g.41161 Transcript_29796/m.41161 type:complete len:325 (+) Transcript_29796:204-1178(+)
MKRHYTRKPKSFSSTVNVNLIATLEMVSIFTSSLIRPLPISCRLRSPSSVVRCFILTIRGLIWGGCVRGHIRGRRPGSGRRCGGARCRGARVLPSIRKLHNHGLVVPGQSVSLMESSNGSFCFRARSIRTKRSSFVGVGGFISEYFDLFDGPTPGHQCTQLVLSNIVWYSPHIKLVVICRWACGLGPGWLSVGPMLVRAILVVRILVTVLVAVPVIVPLGRGLVRVAWLGVTRVLMRVGARVATLRVGTMRLKPSCARLGALPQLRVCPLAAEGVGHARHGCGPVEGSAGHLCFCTCLQSHKATSFTSSTLLPEDDNFLHRSIL